MNRSYLSALAGVAALACAMAAGPAFADMTVKDSTAATITVCSKIVSTVHHPCHVMEGLFSTTPTPLKVASDGTVATADATVHSDLGSMASTMATAALQATANTKLDTINTSLGSLATSALQTSANTKLDTLHADLAPAATATAQALTNTKLDTLHNDLTAATPSGTNTVGDVGSASFGGAGSVCATLTLPGAGGTYASGQGVLNNGTAGSVTNQTCTVGRYAAGPFTLTGARLLSSNTTITNGSFRIHFFVTAPTYASGNGVALSTAHAGHFCSMDVTLGSTSGGLVFSDGADGFAIPVSGSSCTRQLVSGQLIYPVIEARGAYAWTAASTFIIFPQGFN